MIFSCCHRGTTQPASLTWHCVRRQSRCHRRRDKRIPMSSVVTCFHQYYWPPKRNITFPRCILVWIRCRKSGILIHWKFGNKHCPLSVDGERKITELPVCVVGGGGVVVKQRHTDFFSPFMPGHFHMSPLLCYPSITFHSKHDSCLGLKHIHSSAVHQISPNTVILQSCWSRGEGVAGKKSVKEGEWCWWTLPSVTLWTPGTFRLVSWMQI